MEQSHKIPIFRLAEPGSDDYHDIDTEDSENVTYDEKDRQILWALLSSYLPLERSAIQHLFVEKVEYALGSSFEESFNDQQEQYFAAAQCIRDRLIERWKDTQAYFSQKSKKKVYYLSLEFLMGRTLQNALSNLDLTNTFAEALRHLGVRLEDLYDKETDAGLGNGGLGRLAACFLDSLATMNYPAGGYGIRYKYGMFHQVIKDGYQYELPDYWLEKGNPWEIARYEIQYPISFYGRIADIEGKSTWVDSENVVASPFDVPVPGYNTYNTINLRLWNAKPSSEFNLEQFNKGDYFHAVENKQKSETITSVLYPKDNTYQGKELRLKQQYFFVSATIQDIIADLKKNNYSLYKMHHHICIQLNDTHPAMAIPELIRILLDQEGFTWNEAMKIIPKVFSYTNHTLLPEALEKWTAEMLERVLPRHLEIIYRFNHSFLELVKSKVSDDPETIRKFSIVEEQPEKSIRMAYLAIVGSHHVNGVAAIHTELLTTTLFPHFHALWPHKFINVTNGVTQRRWLHQANPGLSDLITEKLTANWLLDLTDLEGLRNYLDDENFKEEWRQVKTNCKRKLVDWLRDNMEINVRENALFDIHIKRIHEYKRQFMNILSVIYRYRHIKSLSDEDRSTFVPRVVIFSGKAAPGYYMAKLIIKLISNVAQTINDDPDTAGLLTVVFIPNYNVSLAELLIPASDISQHISTAGKEASGTSNMKFVMNGGLILGTLDGANIEIKDNVGEENMFIFGATTDEVYAIKSGKVSPPIDERFEETLNLLREGYVGSFDQMHELINTLSQGNDNYLVGVDFGEYLEAQNRVDETYQNKDLWTRMSINSCAGTGFFSSDRSIKDYAEKIWKIDKCEKPAPTLIDPRKLPSYLTESSATPLSMSPGISFERYGRNPTNLLSLSPDFF